MNERYYYPDLPHSLHELSAPQPRESADMSNWPALQAALDAAYDLDATDADQPEIPLLSDRPHAVFVPEHYEPGYAYPLIVWFHGAEANERELLSVMPEISTRNYFGVSVRGNLPTETGAAGAYRWSSQPSRQHELEAEIREIVCAMRRTYHIHSERVYLAGADAGGTAALRLMLQRPEWFGGAISLGGQFPQLQHPLARFRGLQGKRILLASGTRHRQVPIAGMVQAGRLLHAAGMRVATRVYDDGRQLTPKMLRDVDRWLMNALCEVSLV